MSRVTRSSSDIGMSVLTPGVSTTSTGSCGALRRNAVAGGASGAGGDIARHRRVARPRDTSTVVPG